MRHANEQLHVHSEYANFKNTRTSQIRKERNTQTMQNLKLIDSHFHLVNIAEHGLSPAESLSSIVSGIDIGTVYNDLAKGLILETF